MSKSAKYALSVIGGLGLIVYGVAILVYLTTVSLTTFGLWLLVGAIHGYRVYRDKVYPAKGLGIIPVMMIWFPVFVIIDIVMWGIGLYIRLRGRRA